MAVANGVEEGGGGGGVGDDRYRNAMSHMKTVNICLRVDGQLLLIKFASHACLRQRILCFLTRRCLNLKMFVCRHYVRIRADFISFHFYYICQELKLKTELFWFTRIKN